MESGPYPVREGEPDCSYYIRTGLCRFGTSCRFNHPPNRKLVKLDNLVNSEFISPFCLPIIELLGRMKNMN